MTISTKTYEQVALEDPDGNWELACGVLRQKPGMTLPHNSTIRRLSRMLYIQLDVDQFIVDPGLTRLHISTGSYYIPDLCVLPAEFERRLDINAPFRLEIYEDPLPLVVEVWSPSTGGYDVDTKLREYQLRDDAEIWRLHPHERTLTSWRRQADGSYTETVYRDGTIEPIALPGVLIAIPLLFR
ncbi:MAG: Uma2 family endonuclease [Dehalococcoidia bacterium]